MTPDARVFDRLTPRLPTASVVPWINPRSHEGISDYVNRLAEPISIRGDAIVCGVSFGGIIARELAPRLNARACVLISSVRDTSQFPLWMRAVRRFSRLPLEPMLNAIGTVARRYPRRIRSDATARLSKLAGESSAWHRWATAAVLRWKCSRESDSIPVVQIHGDRDTTFPIRYIDADVVIAGGGHVLPLTHAEEIVGLLAGLAS